MSTDIKDALRKFYTDSLTPLREYQERLAELQQEYDAKIEPYKKALEAAEAKVSEAYKTYNDALRGAAQELKAKYDAAYNLHQAKYDLESKSLQNIWHGIDAISTNLYREIVEGKLAEPSMFERTRQLGALTYFKDILGNPDALGVRDSTESVASRLVHTIFLEALKPYESARELAIEPTEKPYREKVGAETAMVWEQVLQSHSVRDQAKLALNREQDKQYKLFLQARIDARKKCEEALQPTKAALEVEIRKVFAESVR